MDGDAPAGEGDQGEQRGEVAKASGAVADEPHSRVHGLQASVVDAQHDGVGDRLAMTLEGDRHRDEGRGLGGGGGEDPLIQQIHRLVMVAGGVDGLQLVGEQPAAVDIAVGVLELLEDTALAGAQGVGAASGS